MLDGIWQKLGYENTYIDAINGTTGEDAAGAGAGTGAGGSKSFYDLKLQLPGQDRWMQMSDLRGKVVLIVNTASKCGFTPQYKGLQKLHETYGEKGLAVIGCPCDQFLHQEPGSDDEIAQACQLNHGVTFPLAKKSDVNGPQMNEVFAWLKSQPNGKSLLGKTSIGWNFEKFLVSKNGEVLGRYFSTTTPDKIAGDIEKALEQ